MTDFSALTKNQMRALDRYPARRDTLEAAFRHQNARDRKMSITLGLAADGVDVGGDYTRLSETYRGRV